MVPDTAGTVRTETLEQLVKRQEFDQGDVERLAARIFDGRSTLILGNGRVLVIPLFEHLSSEQRGAIIGILMGANVAPVANV